MNGSAMPTRSRMCSNSARVRAVMRRGKPEEAGPPPIYRGEHLVADFDAVSIAVDGQQIKLTRREFELLKYLVENRNRVLSRDRLLEVALMYRAVAQAYRRQPPIAA